jgi:hypothetical protein
VLEYIQSQNTGGTQATVFQAEVYAILVCSEHCRNLQLRDKTICMCSDSRASLLALSPYTISSSLVAQCWHSVHELSTNDRVKLQWGPGYCDIEGNGSPNNGLLCLNGL